MRDTHYLIRRAFYAVLQGQVTYAGQIVNFYDEKKKASSSDNVYAIFSTQQSSRSQDSNDSTWITDERIDIEITQKQGFEVTKDFIDDVSNQMYQLLMPTRGQDALPVQNEMQFRNVELETALTRSVQISPTETIISKVITFSLQAVQQME